ncbi:MAG: Glutamate-tRNA ligase [candidate division TM6 bacterium GW2011_GWF2_28_16]|nr:MAG: Glutamate-tRNA ligase [candidate division TM6 bacterium GW2011_GWF2_28_16]
MLKNIRVRFAPSPTGHLHIGSVRVAIFNWLYARHNNGTYLMRVEDTDTQRSTKEFLDSQIDSLRWLNLLPDEPIVYQMSRLEEHKKVINKLLESGDAYPCFCEPEELEKKRQEREALGRAYKYEGTCRNKKYTQDDLKKPHAIRFKVPDNLEYLEFNDLIRGPVKIESDQLDDFIIMRRDGAPTYNFVVVADDIFMQITHVIRGEDHIPNTHKQILIYKALNSNIPVFAHLPLILGPAGNKLSKRDATVSVQEYKQQGFLADALFNYLVRLGWSHGDQELFTREEMVKFFDFDHVGKKGAIFDIKKLEWINGVYIRQSDYNSLVNAIKELGNNYLQELEKIWSQEQLKELFEQYKQRATKLLDMVLDIISLHNDPKVLDLALVQKWVTPNSIDLLQAFLQELNKTSDLSHDHLLNLANNTVEKFNLKLVNLAQLLRLALTGKIMSPGVFELIKILGKDSAVNRITFLIKSLK